MVMCSDPLRDAQALLAQRCEMLIGSTNSAFSPLRRLA
jgi:hypothetical protein